MRIKTNDGAQLAGTPQEIVVELNRGQRLGAEPFFMNAVARRCRLWDGTEVRAEAAEPFLRDIERAGLIEILEN